MTVQFPLVSVIIPTFNREKPIVRAIESIINQTYPNWELLIVDDRSTDNTAKVIARIIEKHPNIFYYCLDKNQGACVARNKGLEKAKGEFITFLDSDDEYLPEKIKKQVELFATSNIPNLGVVSCGREDVSNGQTYSIKIPKYRGNIIKQMLSKKGVGAGTPFLMIKKNVINDQIFFDPNMPAGQDWDFLVRICLKYNFDFVGEPLVRVHHHDLERVYTNTTALKAFELQSKKYKDLMINFSVFQNFTLKQSDLLFVYGYRQEAINLLDDRLKGSIGKYLWKSYFNLFKDHKSFLSKIFLKSLRQIYFR